MIGPDPAPKLPTTRGERLTLALAFMALMGLFAAEILDHFTPSKLSILFMVLAWTPLLVIHELGHALMARAVGWRLIEISIGFGRELWRFHYKGCRVRVRAAPIEGYVLPSPTSLKRVRAKSALVYAAGPGAELLVIAALWAVFGSALFAPAGTDLWLLFAQSVALAAAIGAGFNLLPFSTGGAASDGLGIVTSFMASPAAFASRFSRPFATEAERALYLEQTPRARHWVERGLKHYPTDPQLLSLAAVVQAAEGEADKALEALETLGHPDDHPSNVRNELLANAAWAVLLGQQRHLFTEAVRACERLLQADPSHVRGRLLHGWLLEERGAPDAAYAELMAGYRYSRDAEEEDQFVARLALLAKALDKPALAVRFGAAAEKAALGPTLQRRLQQTLNQ